MTEAQKQELRAELIKAKEQAPTSRQQTGSFVRWSMLAEELGQPFDVTKIPLSKLYQMRRDAMIAFGLHFIKVPLMKAPWYIECEDAQVAAFVDNALRDIYGRYIMQDTSALDFGYQAISKRFALDQPDWTYIDPKDPDESIKKVWDEGKIDAIIWKPFVALKPEHVEPRWMESSGEFNGIKCTTTGVTSFPFLKKENGEIIVDINHAIWVVNEIDSVFGSLWGYPRTGYSYRYWWTYWYNWALADRHFEKDADPPVVVYYPDDEASLDADGNRIDYREHALSVGQDARSGSTIALPGKTITGMDERVLPLREWEIKPLENTVNFEAFNTRFEYLDVMRLRSMLIPEQAFLEGKGGTSSRNVAGQELEAFEESQAILMQDIDDRINKYLIPQLVNLNFPEKRVRCVKKTRGFQAEDVEFTKQIIQLIGQQDATELGVNVREALQRYDIPVLTPEQLAKKRAEIAAQMAAQAAPATPSANGSNGSGPSAAVSRTGFYIQMPELIRLSSKHPDKAPQSLRPIIDVEIVSEVPSEVEGALACFDEDTSTVYFSDEMDDEDKLEYLTALEERLAGTVEG